MSGLYENLQTRPRFQQLEAGLRRAGRLLAGPETYQQQVAMELLHRNSRDARIESAINHNAGFNLEDYAQTRQESPDWLTIEIGPGRSPVGLNRDYSGKSAYIGIDNLSFPQYSDDAAKRFAKLRDTRPDENIFFSPDASFGHDGDDRYIFPDAIADEALICRVYDRVTNPDQEQNFDEPDMTREVARMLRPDGHVIVMDYMRNFEDIVAMLGNSGLEPVYLSRSKRHGTGTDSLRRHLRDVQLFDAAPRITDMLLVAQKPTA